MCDKAVNTDSSTIKFVPECSKTQKMWNKAFIKGVLALIYISDR